MKLMRRRRIHYLKKKHIKINNMSRDKKKLPAEANKKTQSDYQAGKSAVGKTEIISINKKHK